MDRYTGSRYRVFLKPRPPAETTRLSLLVKTNGRSNQCRHLAKLEASATILLKKLGKKHKTVLLSVQCEVKGHALTINIDVKLLNIYIQFCKPLFDDWHHTLQNFLLLLCSLNC